MAFVPNNWKGHLNISVSKLCFKNALGLLINNRSNLREEWIIVWKIAATFWEDRIFEWKFTKMQENLSKYCFKRNFLEKPRRARNCLHYFCTILYVCMHACFAWLLIKKCFVFLDIRWHSLDVVQHLSAVLHFWLVWATPIWLYLKRRITLVA